MSCRSALEGVSGKHVENDCRQSMVSEVENVGSMGWKGERTTDVPFLRPQVDSLTKVHELGLTVDQCMVAPSHLRHGSTRRTTCVDYSKYADERSKVFASISGITTSSLLDTGAALE